ncbi:zinc-binding dehydrogenase [Nocardioides stalactiti]|uniref:zinc-binding dehydrogenase n=1 Tax=Nocardioides stalactiti TaxID=2755356 RepID=UPI001601D231|nr:zinc-binding dehydrogenase [Nocardioides stalactiti]
MRAVVLERGSLTVQEVPEPVPGPGEVLVEVLAAGICGSDKSCANHADGFNRASQALMGIDLLDLDSPIVFGHEFVARVVSYGPDTQQAIPVGTRVVSMPMLLREQPVLLGFAGAEVPGAYAERMLLSEALLIPVPDHLPTEVTALTEPLAVALRSVNRVDTGADDVPLVLGCGPIGLAVIAVLKMRGVGPIVAVDLSAERRDFAKLMGADVTVDPTVESPYDTWMQAAATDDPARMAAPTAVFGQLPLRPTVGFECTGAPGLLQQLVAGAPAGSRISVAGINLDPDTIEPAHGILKELDIRFSLYYSPQEFAETVAHLASGELDAAALITGRVGLDDVAEAFARLGNHPTDAKVLIDPSLG